MERTKNVQRLITTGAVERERIFVRLPVDLMKQVRLRCLDTQPRLSLQDAVEQALRHWVGTTSAE